MVHGKAKIVASVVALCALGAPSVGLADRPIVFLPQRQIERVRERIRKYEWLSSSYRNIKASARRWLARDVEFPDGPTGWYHDYFCPEHGVRLIYDPQKPHEHYCPAGKHYVRGEKLDAYWRATTLGNLVNAARDLATVYAIEGDQTCAKAAGKILVSFGEYYEKYVRGKKPPRLMWQTLDEATYILAAVAAYELIYDSDVFSPEDRATIEGKWLRPTAEFIKSQTRVIHNIHCWQNSALLCLGLVLKDNSLVDFAMNDPRSGFRRQIAEGVLEDGMWYECSFGYHFYTISALENTIVPAMNNGMNISTELVKVRKMFLLPILCADRHFELPSPNDGSGGKLWDKTGAYEFAYWLFPDESRFGGVLQLNYSESASGRSGRSVLLYGRDELPEAGLEPERESVNLEASGLAVLRAWPGDSYLYAVMDYGPQGGGHGHPDKLNVILSGLGQMFSPDLGSAGYGLRIHGSWYRQSLSHNVVVVDRQSQRPSAGKLVDFRGTGDVQWVSARAEEAYRGVRWQRTVFLCDEGYLVIADSLESADDHLFDWVYHSLGNLTVTGAELSPMSREEFGNQPGYDVPTELRAGKASAEVIATWELGRGRRVMLRIPAPEERFNELISAVAPGNPSMIEMPMVVWRKRGREAQFWAVIEPTEAENRVSQTCLSEGALTVRRRDGTSRIFSIQNGKPSVLASR